MNRKPELKSSNSSNLSKKMFVEKLQNIVSGATAKFAFALEFSLQGKFWILQHVDCRRPMIVF